MDASRPRSLGSAAQPKRAQSKRSRALGRPRDDRIDSDVVAAVIQTLQTRGYRAVTIEGIARKIGRARTSLYRRWRSKRHLVAYAVLRELGEQPAPDTGALRDDLTAAVERLRRAFAGTLGQALAGLVADMAHDRALARTIRTEVLASRRSSLEAAFDRARARRQARGDLDIELVLDMLTGPFYYRALFGHAPITRRMTADVVEYVLQVVAPGNINGTNSLRGRS